MASTSRVGRSRLQVSATSYGEQPDSLVVVML